MDIDYGFLAGIPLFDGISSEELKYLLSCLNAKQQFFTKQEILLLEGQPASLVGIVLSGSVLIVKEDYRGNRIILAEASAGELFAEAFPVHRWSICPLRLSAPRIVWCFGLTIGVLCLCVLPPADFMPS
jgi:hypothetical protein